MIVLSFRNGYTYLFKITIQKIIVFIHKPIDAVGNITSIVTQSEFLVAKCSLTHTHTLI